MIWQALTKQNLNLLTSLLVQAMIRSHTIHDREKWDDGSYASKEE